MNHLHAVPESGEIPLNCPGCADYEIQLKGAESTIRRLNREIAALKADPEIQERKAREHDLWKDAERCFAYWQEKCGHPRSRFDFKRFQAIKPFLQSDGPRMCCVAILGAAYDPGRKRRRNGTWHKFDGWETIFRNRESFDSFVERAPEGVR